MTATPSWLLDSSLKGMETKVSPPLRTCALISCSRLLFKQVLVEPVAATQVFKDTQAWIPELLLLGTMPSAAQRTARFFSFSSSQVQVPAKDQGAEFPRQLNERVWIWGLKILLPPK